jgi:hypothetical protein
MICVRGWLAALPVSPPECEKQRAGDLGVAPHVVLPSVRLSVVAAIALLALIGWPLVPPAARRADVLVVLEFAVALGVLPALGVALAIARVLLAVALVPLATLFVALIRGHDATLLLNCPLVFGSEFFFFALAPRFTCVVIPGAIAFPGVAIVLTVTLRSEPDLALLFTATFPVSLVLFAFALRFP